MTPFIAGIGVFSVVVMSLFGGLIYLAMQDQL